LHIVLSSPGTASLIVRMEIKLLLNLGNPQIKLSHQVDSIPFRQIGIFGEISFYLREIAVLFSSRKIFSTRNSSFPVLNTSYENNHKVFNIVSSGGGFFESQEVCLMNDKTDFQQEKTTGRDADQGTVKFVLKE
jgi:hypothetical protein